jgi:hypothetical protein
MGTGATVTVRSVQTPADLDVFLDVPARVYRGDRHWVPPLRSEIAKELGPDNPFLTYGRLQPFVAWRGAEPVGRVVAAVNDRLIEKEGQAIALFGYFECIDDRDVAQALIEAVRGWVRSQFPAPDPESDSAPIILRGPIDLSTHNRCLTLIDGFEDPPLVMMPYNPSYYPALLEAVGFTPAKDAYAYHFPLDTELPRSFEKAYQVAVKSGVTFRAIATQGEDFDRDVKSLYRLFTTAFANNYSSTPRTEAEFIAEAKSLQTLVDPDIFPIAEVNGEMVGFFMALPDYNIALKHVNGRLNFWGILKFLWFRRQIDRGRVLVICSLPEYRRKMVPLALIYLGLRGGQRKGKPYRSAELGYIYADNWSSRKLTEAAGGTISKTYRIYEQVLDHKS